MVRYTKSLFFPPKNKKLARKISIKTPKKYRDSIKKLSKNGITLEEKRALVLARTRATIQLKRPNLSIRERRQFLEIATTKIPPVGKK